MVKRTTKGISIYTHEVPGNGANNKTKRKERAGKEKEKTEEIGLSILL